MHYGSMAVTDFLPGLADVLEKRLGRLGYHLGTFLALAATLFIILSPVGLIVSVFFLAMGVGVKLPSMEGLVPSVPSHILWSWLSSILITIALMWVINWYGNRVANRTRRRIAEHIEGHMNEDNFEHFAINMGKEMEELRKQIGELEKRSLPSSPDTA